MYQSVDSINTDQDFVVAEFGANCCSICKDTRPMIDSVLAQHPNIAHIKIEDAKGKRLGRQHGVKLWPTLVFMKNGIEIQRLVRPYESNQLEDAIRRLQNA